MKPPQPNLSKTYYMIAAGMVLLILGALLILCKAWFLSYIVPPLWLEPNSIITEFWRKPPMNMTTTIYMFNWTNAEEAHNISIKPKFEQLGPYRFLQRMEKVNLTWNDNNTVTYRQMRFLHFDYEHNNGNLSDEVTTFNAFAWFFMLKVKDWNFFTRTAVFSMFPAISPNIYTSRTVKDILYLGYDDLITEFALQFSSLLMPELPSVKNFGILGHKNYSSETEGVSNLDNGINGSFNIRSWNYHNKSYDKTCARLGGSSGELHSPKRSRKDDIEIFLADLCRPISLEYETDSIVDGMLGYKYSARSKVLDNGTLIPGNECYCSGECIPSGVLNMSSCKYGVPVYASLPHFYGADPIYINSVEGMRPEKDKHEAYVVVEPNTGIPLKAALRFQINTRLRPMEDIELFRNLPEIMYPLFWGEIDLSIPAPLLSMMEIYLITPVIYSTTFYILIIIGVFILSIGIVCNLWLTTACKKFFQEKQSIFVKPEETPLRCDE